MEMPHQLRLALMRPRITETTGIRERGAHSSIGRIPAAATADAAHWSTAFTRGLPRKSEWITAHSSRCGIGARGRTSVMPGSLRQGSIEVYRSPVIYLI